jgi:hypothetical protein
VGGGVCGSWDSSAAVSSLADAMSGFILYEISNSDIQEK